jgi:hypothetical protein
MLFGFLNMNLRNLKDKLFGKVYEQPQSLIAILLDSRVDWAERDDAATYLISYNEPEAEEALFKVASNLVEDDDISGSCGECIAEIWCRSEELNLDKLHKLKPAALKEAVGIISVRKPEWMPTLHKEGLTT